MSIQGVFNPYIACGFPGLIIDKYVDLDKLKKLRDSMVVAGYNYRPLTDMLGTHFLGDFTQVTHSIDQSGGTTTINAQYPREYDESIEFLGASNKTTQQAEKKLDITALREMDVAAIDKPPIGAIGPQFGVIMEVKDVTGSYLYKLEQQTNLEQGEGQLKKLPVYGGPRKTGAGELTLKVPIMITKRAGDWGYSIVSQVGNPEQMVSFRAYRIREAVPRYRREFIMVPAEELIRPGWYGDCWHPAFIGKTYDKFFRTGSITDPQQIADPAGASIGSLSVDAADGMHKALAEQQEDGVSTNDTALLTLENGASIQQSVAYLLQVYAYIRMNDLSVDDFIRSYTWRPIASMVDMFGSSDLQFDSTGSTVVKGIEGFHSRAFGQYENLFALVTPEIEKIVGVKRGSNLAKKADVRMQKWMAVRDLVDMLNASKAILG
jgi:hypothetical protein